MGSNKVVTVEDYWAVTGGDGEVGIVGSGEGEVASAICCGVMEGSSVKSSKEGLRSGEEGKEAKSSTTCSLVRSTKGNLFS